MRPQNQVLKLKVRFRECISIFYLFSVRFSVFTHFCKIYLAKSIGATNTNLKYVRLSLIVRMLIIFSAYPLEQIELVLHMFDYVFPMWHMAHVTFGGYSYGPNCVMRTHYGSASQPQILFQGWARVNTMLCCGPSEDNFRSQKYKHSVKDYQAFPVIIWPGIGGWVSGHWHLTELKWTNL